jgi:hypothetical protein
MGFVLSGCCIDRHPMAGISRVSIAARTGSREL